MDIKKTAKTLSESAKKTAVKAGQWGVNKGAVFGISKAMAIKGHTALRDIDKNSKNAIELLELEEAEEQQECNRNFRKAFIQTPG